LNASELDAIDRRILDELLADARIPIATLAYRVHLSRHAIRHRIDRLESLKVISGYTIRLGQPMDDKHAVRAIIMVYRRDRMRGTDVVRAIELIPEVTFCYIVSGMFDLVVHIEAESIDRVNAIWAHLADLPGVQDTHTTFVLSPIIDRHSNPR
jgi:DNA-binding Lrp family transcriptional regulator